jgi:hypothetical protein
MNPWVRNMQKTEKFKDWNVNLVNVHFVGLYFITIESYMIYLLPAIGLSPGGSSTVHIYTQTIYRTTQNNNLGECGPCPVLASYTLAFALQLRKKHGKPPVISVCCLWSNLVHLDFCIWNDLSKLQTTSSSPLLRVILSYHYHEINWKG